MKKLILLSLSVIAVSLFSCEDEKNARIEVWLTDAPGDYQEVNIDLQGVEINSSHSNNETGWQALNVTAQVYNLLDLTNGVETLLGSLELPGGRISQIRLKLGENNSIKVADQVFPLNTPSAQQSGLKIQINQVLAEGINYKVLLDFDAAKSVVETGDNTFLLKPVVRAITEAQDGAIKGRIEPGQEVSISVFSGQEIVTTTSSNDDGEFLVRGLEAGMYKLIFDFPGDAPDIERSNVIVELGVVTEMEVIQVAE